ncbi:MAG TPA: YfiR family protein [Sphingobacteriaceae bacterium]
MALLRIIRRTIYNQKFLPGLFLVLLSATEIGMISPVQKESPNAAQVKAVFLFNFAQFVEWPDQTFPAAKAPLIIGVLGKDPFKSYLDETILGESINGHPLIIHRYNKLQDIKNCHILYINLYQPDQLEDVLAALKGRRILTVSDAPKFAQSGGIIQFVTVNNKIRMRINQENAQASELTISSKLLRLAEIVSSTK